MTEGKATNQTGRGKYSKVIRELHEQLAALESVMGKMLLERDAEIERLKAEIGCLNGEQPPSFSKDQA